MAQWVLLGVLVGISIFLDVGEATPPGIANNPTHASCNIKKYKHCYNLVHVWPKFFLTCHYAPPSPPDHHNPPPPPTPPKPDHSNAANLEQFAKILVSWEVNDGKDSNLCLVSDPNMNRDFTWAKSIAILFNNHQIFIGGDRRESENNCKGFPITKEDSRIHLDLGFKFMSLSEKVSGVLGQTYRPDYVSGVDIKAKMPVMGGDKEFKPTALFLPDCSVSRFAGNHDGLFTNTSEGSELPGLSCASGIDGQGVVCKT